MEKQHIFALIALIVIIALALYQGFGRKKKDTGTVTQPYTFFTGLLPMSNEGHAALNATMYGDSISVPSKLGEVLANKLGVGFWFDNLAVAGTMLMQWASPGGIPPVLLTMKEQLAQDKHSVIFHRYGINDAIQNAPIGLFRLALVDFVRTCRELNKIPVLVGLTQFSSQDAGWQARRAIINNIIYEVACTEVVHYIDLDRVAFDPAVDTPDQLHPSTAYYARIDDFLADQAIAQNIFIPV